MIISVTDLSAYLFCPRSLYLQRVLNVEEPPSQAMIAGMIKHAVLEQASVREKDAFVELRKDQSQADFERVFSGTYLSALQSQLVQKAHVLEQFNIRPELITAQLSPLLLSEAKTRADSVFRYAEEKGIYGYELWETIIPKVLSEVRTVSKELMLRGRIDKVELFPDKCIVHELKTGKMPENGVWPSHRVQASAYCMLAEKKFNVSSRESVLNYSSTGKQKRLIMNPFMQQEVVETTGKVIGLLESEEAPEPCNRTCCRCRHYKNIYI